LALKKSHVQGHPLSFTEQVILKFSEELKGTVLNIYYFVLKRNVLSITHAPFNVFRVNSAIEPQPKFKYPGLTLFSGSVWKKIAKNSNPKMIAFCAWTPKKDV
jgi:hypothetical protein